MAHTIHLLQLEGRTFFSSSSSSFLAFLTFLAFLGTLRGGRPATSNKLRVNDTAHEKLNLFLRWLLLSSSGGDNNNNNLFASR